MHVYAVIAKSFHDLASHRGMILPDERADLPQEIGMIGEVAHDELIAQISDRHELWTIGQE